MITVFVPGCREEAGSDLKGYGLFKRIVAERSSTETEFDPFLHVLSSEYPLWPDILERLYGESDDPTYKAAVIKIMCALADNQRQVQVVDGRLERILREGLFSDETDLAALCVQTLTRKAVFRQHEELLLKRLETVNDTRLITEIICALPSELAANAVMAQLCLPSSSCGNKEFRQWQLRSRYFIEGLRLRNRAGIWDLPIKSYMKLAESLMNAMANDESLISPLGVEALLEIAADRQKKCRCQESVPILRELWAKTASPSDKLALAAALLALDNDSVDLRRNMLEMVRRDVAQYKTEDSRWIGLWLQARWLGLAAVYESQPTLAEDLWNVWHGLRMRDRTELLSMVLEKFMNAGPRSPNADRLIALLDSMPEEELRMIVVLHGVGENPRFRPFLLDHNVRENAEMSPVRSRVWNKIISWHVISGPPEPQVRENRVHGKV